MDKVSEAQETQRRREELWTTIAIEAFRQGVGTEAATTRADAVLEAFDKARSNKAEAE